MIRIANGQGFWGDSLEAPIEQIRRGPIDYLTLDYLAEITMSILQKQFTRDPRTGYARDFVEMIARGARDIADRRIRVVANAGGVNPQACADAVLKTGLTVAIVAGDNILDRLDDLIARGVALKNLDTGAPLESVRPRVQSANVYFGGAAIAYALGTGAQVVITGRTTDTGLVLGPLIHEYKWKPDEWDKLAAGTIAGHTVECGAQCTGGNCQVDWQTIPNFADIGYPIVEAEPDGTFVITKHAGTGGRDHGRLHQRTTAIRNGRPARVHHTRLHRRLHQHPAPPRRPRSSPLLRHPRPPGHGHVQSFDQLFRRLQGSRHSDVLLARRVR